jgi:hypothetical protein
MYYKRQIAGVALLGGLAAAGWRSVTLARADAAFRQGTPEGTARALELAPTNTEYLSLASLQTEYAGGDPRPLLERIASLNPTAAAPRIQLGLAAEVRGDAAEAERWLLEAWRVDRQFETRWTLANFYLRQGRAEDFWTWMRSALEMSYGDRRPAFDLCWRMSSDAGEIAGRAIPGRAEVLAAYVSYLLDTGRAASAGPVALRLARAGQPGYRPLLYAAVDGLIEARRGSEAVELWRALGHAAPSGVTNPDFAAPLVEHGFDWRTVRLQGVTHLDLDAPAGHRIRLSGAQPESAELLRQTVGGLRPGQVYRLRWEARTEQLRPRGGLQWRIAGAAADVQSGELTFTAPAEIAILTLYYTRPPGEVRAEGWLDLRGVRLSPNSVP